MKLTPDQCEDVASGKIGEESEVTLADGTKVTLVHLHHEEGEVRRWTQTDSHVFGLKGADTQGWMFFAERNPSDHDGGADGFRDHTGKDGLCHGVRVGRVHQVVTTVHWLAITEPTT